MFDVAENSNESITIKAIGIGKDSYNAIRFICSQELSGVSLYYVIPSQEQRTYPVEVKFYRIEDNSCANTLSTDIDLLHSDILFIICDNDEYSLALASVIAKSAQLANSLTLGISLYPEEVLNDTLMQNLDSLITISNTQRDFLTKINSVFQTDNVVYFQTVKCLSDIFKHPGLIKLDFADIKMILKGQSVAMIGYGHSTGEKRAEKAGEIAINSLAQTLNSCPQLSNTLVCITAGMNLELIEFEAIGNAIRNVTEEGSTIIMSTSMNTMMTDSLSVTVITLKNYAANV